MATPSVEELLRAEGAHVEWKESHTAKEVSSSITRRC
jgi:hypothetical protein